MPTDDTDSRDEAQVFNFPKEPGVLLDFTTPNETTTVVEEFPDACACGSAFWTGLDEDFGPYVSYGLAGGGMGAYLLCSVCDRVTKILDPIDGGAADS